MRALVSLGGPHPQEPVTSQSPSSVNTIMLDISFQHMNSEGADFETLSRKCCHPLRVRGRKEPQAKAWRWVCKHQGPERHQSVSMRQSSHVGGNGYRAAVQMEKCLEAAIRQVSQ